MDMGEREALEKIIDAWEALPGGRDFSVREISAWLSNDMTPAINAARKAIGRKAPYGR
jgi:hypothetical protein